jgi:hypothetical protein
MKTMELHTGAERSVSGNYPELKISGNIATEIKTKKPKRPDYQ